MGVLSSPFVRRVAVTLAAYRIDVIHHGLSSFTELAEFQRLEPVGRMPLLVLPDTTVLTDSSVIIDYLDTEVGPARALTPTTPPDRTRVLALTATALGFAEKCVEYRSETIRRPPEMVVEACVARIGGQIGAALQWLERQAATAGPWLTGEIFTQADLTLAVAVTNLRRKLPAFFDAEYLPALARHQQAAEARPEFRAMPYPGDG